VSRLIDKRSFNFYLPFVRALVLKSGRSVETEAVLGGGFTMRLAEIMKFMSRKCYSS